MSVLTMNSISMSANPTIHYSCGTCGGESFISIESHREHFRSEWHRYNLKRRVAGLFPVSQNDFATKAALFASSLSSSSNDTSVCFINYRSS